MASAKRVLIAVLVVATIGAGAAWLYVARDHRQTGRGLVLYGNIDLREVQPAFHDNGRIERMLVEEGAVVKAGALIARLDDSRYRAALAQAEGELRKDQETLKKLLAGSRPEEIAAAKATMEALQASADNDAVNYRRFAILAQTSAASVRQRDDAKAALDAARQQYEAARQKYLLAVRGPRAEDIAAARAAVDAARAAVALARRELADTRLYAPSDGIVETRILEPGDMASPATPVYTIALTRPLWVRAYVAETDLGKIAPGMRAVVTTDNFPGRTYQGWIGFISPSAEFTPKSVETPELRTALVYQVRIFVCDSRNQLRLGMPASVTIDLPQPAPRKPAIGCGPVDRDETDGR